MRRRALSSAAALVALLACVRAQPTQAQDAGAFAPWTDAQVVEWVYRGALKSPRWLDFGYAPHGPQKEGPQALDLSRFSGWILATRTVDTSSFGDFVFRYQPTGAPGEFLDVKLADGDDGDFPKLKVSAVRQQLVDGWFDVRLPMAELNPTGRRFDRVRFKAGKQLAEGWVKFDQVGFLARVAGPDAGHVPPPVQEVSLAVNCHAPGHAISPWIYGIASSHKLDAPYEELGATVGRWGGNTSSRYNWELGNAWNSGVDWYFKNTDYSNRDGFTWRDELAFNRAKGVKTALTVPTLGWVAKDRKSFSFPVSELGPQDSADGDAGNGLERDGKTKLTPLPPTRTSVASTPESVARWVTTLRAEDQQRGTSSVLLYFLDNEPALWNDTHRDVHPEALTYDELLSKTIAYGTAVRKAAPDALLAGPAEWGWTGYFYSAADVEAGVRLRPDRRAHGDEPLLPWYLKQLAAHEKKTGVRVLDVLDVHFYPQGRHIGIQDKGRTDAATAALRLRSTRGLWDPAYVDESWIKEPVMLVPRLKRWIADNYPGLKVSIGEYNWGAESHPSGALALAEVLGRFGEQDVFSAFYWRVPKRESPAWHAFRAYGNYDGAGARFPSWHLPTRTVDGVSLFAARDEASTRLVLVALNLEPDRARKATVTLDGCARVKASRTFLLAPGTKGLEARPPAPVVKSGLVQELPPYSVTVVELVAEPKKTP